MYEQHGRASRADHLASDAAEHCAGDAGTSVRRHNNQVGGGQDNAMTGLALPHEHADPGDRSGLLDLLGNAFQVVRSFTPEAGYQLVEISDDLAAAVTHHAARRRLDSDEDELGTWAHDVASRWQGSLGERRTVERHHDSRPFEGTTALSAQPVRGPRLL